jgi:hypothetical protein
MALYTGTFDSIRAEFLRRGIPVEKPGFYDHPAFLQLKAEDPEALCAYARYVIEQPYAPEYFPFAENTIHIVSGILYRELVLDGRLGACIDTSMVMSRILDRLGVWNFIVNGAVTTVYPQESSLTNGYYWPIHKSSAQAGHAWISAPPFSVVDMTIGRQPQDFHPHDFVPDFVYSKERADFPVYIDDICSEAVRAEMAARGTPISLEGLFREHPRLQAFFAAFPGTLYSHNGALYEYIPVDVLEPIGPLEAITDLCLNGKFGHQIWKEKIAPLFA